jgi:hypothetical protein
MFLLMYHLFRAWLEQPAFQGMGPVAFFFVEIIVSYVFFESLSTRWYAAHRETLGTEKARWGAAWIGTMSFIVVIATIAFAMNVP